MIGYFASHWRGEQSLAKSFWLNVVVGYVLVIALLVGIGQVVHAPWFLYVGMIIFTVQFIWGSVGMVRCALRIVCSSASIPSKFWACLALAAIAVAVIGIAKDVTSLVRMFA
jgi:hypothetical protein